MRLLQGRPPSESDGGIFVPKFFVFGELSTDNNVEITGEDAHHIINVLRHKPGDVIKISNGRDLEGTGIIEEVDKRNIKLKIRIIEKSSIVKIRPVISLYQGLLKGNKMDFVIQKSTELGVSRIVPLTTQRTVVDISGKKYKVRASRWEKIAKEASKQCMRPDILQVEPVLNFDEALVDAKKHQKLLIPWELEKSVSLKNVLRPIDKSICNNIAVFIGPEGGFSEEEVKIAIEEGFEPVTLGPRILRSETASITVCSVIMYELGDVGGQDA